MSPHPCPRKSRDMQVGTKGAISSCHTGEMLMILKSFSFILPWKLSPDRPRPLIDHRVVCDCSLRELWQPQWSADGIPDILPSLQSQARDAELQGQPSTGTSCPVVQQVFGSASSKDSREDRSVAHKPQHGAHPQERDGPNGTNTTGKCAALQGQEIPIPSP